MEDDIDLRFFGLAVYDFSLRVTERRFQIPVLQIEAQKTLLSFCADRTAGVFLSAELPGRNLERWQQARVDPPETGRHEW